MNIVSRDGDFREVERGDGLRGFVPADYFLGSKRQYRGRRATERVERWIRFFPIRFRRRVPKRGSLKEGHVLVAIP